MIHSLKTPKETVFVTEKLSYGREKILGSGSFGTYVHQGQFENRPVAVKKMIRRRREIVDREVVMLQKTDAHPNIVRYFCTEMNEDFYFIALELCVTSLADYFRPEFKYMRNLLGVIQVLKQTLNGLNHLHQRNIIHRDIKPQNILISKDNGTFRIKISDFGISKELDNLKTCTCVTSLMNPQVWIAPELLNENKSSKASDVFSLGCLFNFMLTLGRFPFDMKILQSGTCVFELKFDENLLTVQSYQKQSASELIVKMIHSEAAKRPSINWIRNHNMFLEACTRLQFLLDICKFLETRSVNANVLEVKLNVRPATVINGNWVNLLPIDLVSDLKKRKHKNVEENVTDLIRYIRNKWTHSGEWSEEMRKIFGTSGETFLNYWCETFPQLWKHLQMVVEENLTFFGSTFRQFYSNVQNPSCLRASLNLITKSNFQNIDFTKPDNNVGAHNALTSGQMVQSRPLSVNKNNVSQSCMNHFTYEKNDSRLIIDFYKNLQNESSSLEIEFVKTELSRMSIIKTVYIRFCILDSCILDAILDCCLDVKNISIHNSEIVESNLYYEIDANHSNIHNIESLSLKSSGFMPRKLLKCTSLSFLELEDFPEDSLVQHIVQQKNLDTLLLSAAFHSEIWVQSSFQLRSLFLDLMLDSQEQLNNFLNFMKNQSSIESLCLKFTTGIDQKYLDEILNFVLLELNSLKHLELHPFPEIDNTFIFFCVYFDSYKFQNFNIRYVKISNCDEKSFKKLKKKMKKCLPKANIYGLEQTLPGCFVNLLSKLY